MKNKGDRQSFLGPRSSDLLRSATVAIVGLGGGGSHVAQQLSHLGVGNLILFDPDRVEPTNLNRLVGATLRDAEESIPKVDVAKRLAGGISPTANIIGHKSQWQIAASSLRDADVAVSCVDTYAARQDLEVSTRRFLIPLIDIGMDVHMVGNQPHISGQVILSLPGGPCFRCLGFLTDENLRQEAELYGAAGGRPQVVWANGVLASVAVGIAVELLTTWRERKQLGEYLHYDGNENVVSRSPRLLYAPKRCIHFEDLELGEPAL